MISFLFYTVGAYLLWWLISRLGVLGAWIYSKPGTITVRHYALIATALCPFAFELICTVLVTLSIAFGFDPHKRDR